jgi:hypothetical protein
MRRSDHLSVVKAPNTAAGTPGQQLYREFVLGTLLYSVVVGFFDAYTSIVDVRSYSSLFVASIVLELLTVGAFWIKDLIVGALRHRQRARAKAFMGFGVWFVMFSSKFVFIWVIDSLFGDDVNVNGFFGILVVVASVTVLHRLAVLVDSRLAAPLVGSDNTVET